MWEKVGGHGKRKEGREEGARREVLFVCLYQIRKVTSGCHSRTDLVSPREKETTRLEINLVDFSLLIRTIVSRRRACIMIVISTSPHYLSNLSHGPVHAVSGPPSLDEAQKSTKKETTSQDENEPTCSTFSSLESPVLSTLQNQNQNHIQARLAPAQISSAMPHCSTSMIQPASF